MSVTKRTCAALCLIFSLLGLAEADELRPVGMYTWENDAWQRTPSELAWRGEVPWYDYDAEISKIPKKHDRDGQIFQKLAFGATWIPAGGDHGLGMTRATADLTLALPGPNFPNIKRSFFLLSPTFGYTAVDWQRQTAFPDSLFHAGVGVTWITEISDRWMLMAGGTPVWSSDGRETRNCVRCPAYAGVVWSPDPRWKFTLGVSYMAQSNLPVLPFGGVSWTPNDDWRIEIMAPRSRIGRRLTGISTENLQHWLYVAGGYDWDSWAVRSTGGAADFAMYHEYSVLLGYECVKTGCVTWNIEIGTLFWRKMEFDRGTQGTFRPEDSVVLRTKISF